MVKNDVLVALVYRAKSNDEIIANNLARIRDIYLTNEAINIASYRLGKSYIDKIYNLNFSPYASTREDLILTNQVLKEIIADIKNN